MAKVELKTASCAVCCEPLTTDIRGLWKHASPNHPVKANRWRTAAHTPVVKPESVKKWGEVGWPEVERRFSPDGVRGGE